MNNSGLINRLIFAVSILLPPILWAECPPGENTLEEQRRLLLEHGRPQPSTRPAATLAAGGSSSPVYLFSRLRKNHTGIKLEQGKTYSIRFTEASSWCDAAITSDHQGWVRENLSGSQKLLHAFSRPFSRFWKTPLFGVVGGISGHRFSRFDLSRTGNSQFEAPASGELYLFANDLWPMYFNNHGYLLLTVSAVE